MALAFFTRGISVPAMRKLRTAIYVDGFNLYYRAVKGTPFKWLDQLALYRSLLRPSNEIHVIRYFTAMISGRRDAGAPVRQQTYLRALRTHQEVRVHLGRFLVTEKWSAIAGPPATMLRPAPVTVRVVKTEEKGSDVNLGCFLLRDAFLDGFDVAIVVSNDTDLVEPMRMVIQELAKPVGLICPAPAPARSLTRVATFLRHLTPARLAAAQFPDQIPGTRIEKPETW